MQSAPNFPRNIKFATIRNESQDNLIISEDLDEGSNPTAVLLYTPNMKNTKRHWHIELNFEQATALLYFLEGYCFRYSITKGFENDEKRNRRQVGKSPKKWAVQR